MPSGELGGSLDRSGTFSGSQPALSVAFPIATTQLLYLLLGCFALHVLLRCVVSETAGIDDVDQVLRAQIWSWGYGPQPPLYTWLTKIFLNVFGYSVFSLLLLKELLVFSIYGLVFASARQLTRSNLCAVAATALLQANFSIAWEAHRELTHTVLVSAMSVATIYFFLRLAPDRWTSYLWFGTCSGLGMLSKYNFVILWVALWLSAFSIRELRPVLLNRRMLGALFIAGVICLPHFFWVFQHRELAFSSVQKLKIATNWNWTQLAAVLGKWILAALAHIGPMLAIVALVFGQGFKRFSNATTGQTLLWRTIWWVVILVTANIILFRVTGVRDRYVQPFFVWLPILIVASLRQPVSSRRVALLLGLSVLAAGVILLVAPGRVLLTEWLRKKEVLNTPFRKLAQDLTPAIETADCVIAENHTLAGNLRLWFPNKLVLDPEVGPLFASGSRKCLLVWNADNHPSPPAELLKFTKSFTGKDSLGPINAFQELLKYHHRRTIRLAAAEID